MAQTDYEKVEKRLSAGLLKIMISQLLELADERTASQSKKKITSEEAFAAARQRLLTALQADMKRLEKRDSATLEKLGISKAEIKKYVDDPNSLTPEDWKKLKSIKSTLDNYKKEMLAPLEKNMNEKIVKTERVKQKNARHNTRDGWLPLH